MVYVQPNLNWPVSLRYTNKEINQMLMTTDLYHVLPVISKILEKHVCKNLMAYLTKAQSTVQVPVRISYQSFFAVKQFSSS